MKFNKKIAIVLLILTSFTTQNVLSQNKIDTELLTGTWVFDYDKTIAEMDPEKLEDFNKITSNPARLSLIEETYKNRKIFFLERGHYIQEQANGNKIEATWKIKNGNIIKLLNTKGSGKSYQIVKLNNDQLILITGTVSNRKRTPLFSTCYFKKAQ